MEIGNWIKRKGAFRRHVDPDGTERWTGPRWHLVESVVADRAVIRCGKEMASTTPSGGELKVSALMPLTRMIGQPQLCRAGCQRDEPVSEDDGSKTEETEPA